MSAFAKFKALPRKDKILLGVMGAVCGLLGLVVASSWFYPSNAQTTFYHRETIPLNKHREYTALALINGTKAQMTVDTGATEILLSYETALRVGLEQQLRAAPKVRVELANGGTWASKVMLNEIKIGDIAVRDLEALVSNPGSNLLGMTFLSRITLRSADGVLTLEQGTPPVAQSTPAMTATQSTPATPATQSDADTARLSQCCHYPCASCFTASQCGKSARPI